VLIYFEPDARRVVVSRLLRHLVSDGYLFVGHAETLAGAGTQARAVASTVYAPAET
jgi:chemotaxis methyl-accepting protein methylase